MDQFDALRLPLTYALCPAASARSPTEDDILFEQFHSG